MITTIDDCFERRYNLLCVLIDQLEKFVNDTLIKVSDGCIEWTIIYCCLKKQWLISISDDYIVLLDNQSVKQYFEETCIESIHFNHN